jgi:tellurite resistance protein
MNTFLRKGFDEYLRRTDLKRNFASHNELVFRLFEESGFSESDKAAGSGGKQEELYLLLLTPLVEVAWADGRVTARESDAILQTADCYGVTAHEDLYCTLMETMISRPSPKTAARGWHRLHRLFTKLSPDELDILGESLLSQAHFVAEQSSNNLIGFLRGDGICRDEETILQKIGEELNKARRAREAEIERIAQEEFEKLLPLAPLVKVAWAEGRITKRERRLILDAARRFGIKPESASYRRLLGWLELHPNDDFYNESLEILSRRWENLDAHERALRSLDVLSDCALVAEASGGNRHYPAGGSRVCEEEIKALRRIAQTLKNARTMALA